MKTILLASLIGGFCWLFLGDTPEAGFLVGCHFLWWWYIVFTVILGILLIVTLTISTALIGAMAPIS